MAEDEIAIILKAYDEFSTTMNKLKSSMQDTANSGQKNNDELVKSNKEVASSFKQTTEGLLALGNMASSVESITSSYTNLQLRLENAHERVAGAQDRVREALYNLSKVQKDTTSTGEDLANAQQNVESAQRSLTISTNNLARANGQALGTYINIVMQTVRFVASIPDALAAINKMITVTKTWNVAESSLNAVRAIGLALTGPYGWAILAGAGIIASATVVTLGNADAQEKLNEATANGTKVKYEHSLKNIIAKATMKDLGDETKNTTTQMDEQAQSMTDLMNILTGKSGGHTGIMSDAEKNARQEVLDIQQQQVNKQGELNAIKSSYDYTHSGDNPEVKAAYNAAQSKARILEGEIQALESKEKYKQNIISNTFDVQQRIWAEEAKLKTDYANRDVELSNTSSNLIYENIKNATVKINSALDITLGKMSIISSWNGLSSPTSSGRTFSQGGQMFSGTPNTGNNGNIARAQAMARSSTKVNDAIITKTGQVIETSPDDNIFASKGGFGNTLVIEISGDNYGVDAKQISQLLAKELGKKLSL